MEYGDQTHSAEIGKLCNIESITTEKSTMVRFKDYFYIESKELGKGSFGVVYLGFWLNPVRNQRVAIKKINLLHDKDKFDEIMKSIKSEIEALMNLRNNPHILKLYDFIPDKTNSCVYLVLEYCNEKDLYSLISEKKRNGRITEIDIRYYFMQLLKAFQKMREKNVVHRDIKPQNILVHNNVLKIGDFGLAKAKIMKDSPKLYESVGTKLYAAPEVMRNKGEGYTEKCDIFSLGTILYWMCYGQCPLEVCNQTGKDYEQASIPYPENADVQLSKRLISVMKRMLKFNYQQRIDWGDLFKHKLFDEQEINKQLVVKPVQLEEEGPRQKSLKSNRIKEIIREGLPGRLSAYMNDEYRRNEEEQEFGKRILKQYTFEQTKVEYLKYVRRNLEAYSVDGRSLLEEKKLEINLLKELVVVGIEKTIKSILAQIKGELNLSEANVRIFVKDRLDKLTEPVKNTLLAEVEKDLKVQARKVCQLETGALMDRCHKYGIAKHFEGLFEAEQLPQFSRDFKAATLQLVHRLQKDVPKLKMSEDVNRSKATILIIHQLFMICMFEVVFTRDNAEAANPNLFFETERRLGQQPYFTKLQLRIREMLGRFKFT